MRKKKEKLEWRDWNRLSGFSLGMLSVFIVSFRYHRTAMASQKLHRSNISKRSEIKLKGVRLS
jgi:hypothetical protein